MKEELITFETAKLAKEKGFGDITLIPTQSLLQKWLREVHSIDVFIVPAIKENHYEWLLIDNDEMRTEADECFVTYEQALEEGLKEALKLIP